MSWNKRLPQVLAAPASDVGRCGRRSHGNGLRVVACDHVDMGPKLLEEVVPIEERQNDDRRHYPRTVRLSDSHVVGS
jgi:hypothetical protein